MTNILISLLIAALRGKLGADLLLFLQTSILTLANNKMPGEEKKKLLLENALALGGSIGEQMANASGWMLNLVIELLVARTRLQ